MKALSTLYAPAMVARSGSYSPSAEKPAAVVEDLLERGVELAIEAPAPVTLEDLYRAHDRAYVDGVLELKRANGFGNRSAEVARSLLYTSGAMLSGARRAMADRVAFAPCSGFHHACWRIGGGFCTFNGLMVAALALLAEGAAKRVAVLDCDMHYGNGTDDILDRLGRPATILHFTAGAKFHQPSQVSAFFDWLGRAVDDCGECEVVLYQAGADPHVDDPLGGFLTTEQLRERDARVFEGLSRRGAAVVWNLAGGYRRRPDGSIPDVLEVHRGTALECVRVYGEGRDAWARRSAAMCRNGRSRRARVGLRRVGDGARRRAVARAVARAFQVALAAPIVENERFEGDLVVIHAHGRLTGAEQAQVWRRALLDVVRPCASALLAGKVAVPSAHARPTEAEQAG